jgi:outer membrane protein TolC
MIRMPRLSGRPGLLSGLSCAACLALAALAPSARAEQGALAALFQQAALHNPVLASQGAREAASAALSDTAASLTPLPPRITAGYLTDRAARNRGAQEAEVELSAPLWLPGEGSALARRAVAERRAVRSGAAATALELAGTVRGAAWDYVLAQRQQAVGRDRLALAEQLVGRVRRQVEKGDAAQIDLAAAVDERAQAAGSLELLRAEEEAARQALSSLVGDAALPTEIAEETAAADAGPNPRVEAARDAVGAARATVDHVRASARERPEVGVVYRRTVAERQLPADNMVGLRVTIPFGGPQHRPPVRIAEADLTKASAELAQTERAVENERRRATLARRYALAQHQSAQERRAAAADRADRADRAYRAGEISTIELVRAQQALNEAESALAAADIRARRSRSEELQAQGVLP